MFKSKQLIYIHIPKTAGNHITRLLEGLFIGETAVNDNGKHMSATPAEIISTPYIISSIRNPWEWYLSLWTFGVAKRGSVRAMLLQSHTLNTLKLNHKYSILKLLLTRPKATINLLKAYGKDVKMQRSIYSNANDVVAFRRWLLLLHNTPYNKLHNLTHQQFKVDNTMGFMTYRYLCLCCNYHNKADTADLSNFEQLQQFDAQNCYINFFIRQENLIQDFCRALEQVKKITLTEKKIILATKKTNTSNRPLSITDYYDKKSIALVQQKDRLIIKKFGYFPPPPPQ